MTNEEFQKLILSQLSELKISVNKIENRLDKLDGQLDEHTTLLRVLEHRSQVQAAETETLRLTTASKEAMERIEAKLDRILATQTTQGESINILALRQLQLESEVAALKKAK